MTNYIRLAVRKETFDKFQRCRMYETAKVRGLALTADQVLDRVCQFYLDDIIEL